MEQQPLLPSFLLQDKSSILESQSSEEGDSASYWRPQSVKLLSFKPYLVLMFLQVPKTEDLLRI
jgi:hypothetical protein